MRFKNPWKHAVLFRFSDWDSTNRFCDLAKRYAKDAFGITLADQEPGVVGVVDRFEAVCGMFDDDITTVQFKLAMCGEAERLGGWFEPTERVGNWMVTA